jgi:hypothetical protein
MLHTLLVAPFIAIGIALDIVVSAFQRMPLIGQIIIVVAIALSVIAYIVESAVRRITNR